MALINLATYKTLTNTTDNTYDSLITTLLDVATVEIQNYCDRIFTEDTYTEWTHLGCKSNYIPKQYPINKVLLVGSPNTALTIVNSGTGISASYTIHINDDKLMTITTSSLVETEFDLTNAAYDTLTELGAAITVAFPNLVCTVGTDVSQISSLLKPHAYIIEAGEQIEVLGVDPSGYSALVEDNVVYIKGYGGFSTSSYADFVLVYKAGYSTIPSDLQMICANITQDALNVQTGEQNSSIKQESITNYSYTLGDTVDFRAIVQGYASGLNAYKQIRF